MKITTTKTFAKFMQDNFKNYKITKEKLSVDEFKLNVDYNTMEHIDNDFDFIQNTFSVIKITYPNNYYAMPKYLTTKDLVKCYDRSNKTLQDFINELKNEIEI